MYVISDNQDLFDIPDIIKLLKQSYWANSRSQETVLASIRNSLCFGIYTKNDNQLIGFARVITDYATCYYLCDVIIEENFRGKGIGSMLIEHVLSDPRLIHLKGMLLTQNAHKFYEKYGFTLDTQHYMGKSPQ